MKENENMPKFSQAKRFHREPKELIFMGLKKREEAYLSVSGSTIYYSMSATYLSESFLPLLSHLFDSYCECPQFTTFVHCFVVLLVLNLKLA